jgi:hypothetical protein
MPEWPLYRRADQLHDQGGLADAGTAEHGSLAALHERCQKVDDLDADMKDFDRTAVSGKHQRWGHGSAAALYCPAPDRRGP